MYRVLIESPLLGPADEVVRLHGSEALGELFEYHVTVALPDPSALRGREAELLEGRFTLLFEDERRIVSQVHSIAREVKIRASANQETGTLDLWLVPRVWTLTLGSSSQIFLDRTIPEIVAEKLTGAGFEEGLDFAIGLRARYPSREFTVQYRESDFAFIARLCEHAGITLFFKHDNGRDRAVFTDSADAYEPAVIEGGLVRYDRKDDKRAAMEIVQTFRRVPERVLVHDYNYRSPQVELLAARQTARPVAQGAVIAYGDHAKSPEEITNLARVRSEGIAAQQHVTEARTRQLALRAGDLFSLEGPDDTEHRLLITRIVVRSHEQGAAGAPEAKAWHNEVTAIPAGVPFRPPLATPKPRIEGLIHAVIDGEVRGSYAEIDEQGRYRVRFNYDLAGRPGLRATHPIRMMQPHAGARYGMHFPLRAGAEVLIGFVEGDPDRPVIVGSIPNPVTPSPVDLTNVTHNVLRSQSGNEIVMDDVIDQERIRIHTPNQNTTIQMGFIDEPELGVLIATDANISEVSGESINESTPRKVEITQTSAAVVGSTSVVVAGVPSIERAVQNGMQTLSAVGAEQASILADLERISSPPGAFVGLDPNDIIEGMRLRPPGGSPGPFAGLWSDLGASLAEAARDACIAAVRSIAEAADTNRQDSIGRRQGEPLGQPDAPAVIHASSETAALVGRSRTIVHGERIATVSSFDTVSVVGGKTAELKSPGTIEVAGATRTLMTSAGAMDFASNLLRVVAGYYPEKEAPDLDDGTSIGMMARRDMRLTSIEDCILLCAHKNLVASAHTGDMRLKAQKSMLIRGGGVAVSGGKVALSSGGDITVDAAGCITINTGGDVTICAGGCVSILAGGSATISASDISLNAPVTVNGDLTVNGAINGG